MKKIKPQCYIGKEYLDKCPSCNGKIRFIQEGTFKNLLPDIVECNCTRWTLPNSLEFMGQTLTWGSEKIKTL